MKKYIIILVLLLITANKGFSQNNLYLIFDINEPDVVKNVYKNARNNVNDPRMRGCAMFMSGNEYIYMYMWYYGIDLRLVPNPTATAQMMTQAQALALYPQARTAAQFDLQMQPYIDYDYITPLPNRYRKSTSATITYLRSFTRIFVIEFLPNNQAKVIECVITSMH